MANHEVDKDLLIGSCKYDGLEDLPSCSLTFENDMADCCEYFR